MEVIFTMSKNRRFLNLRKCLLLEETRVDITQQLTKIDKINNKYYESRLNT